MSGTVHVPQATQCTLKEGLLLLEIPLGNFGLPFKKSRFLRKFFVWEDQNRLTIYIPHRNFRIFVVNGKQPITRIPFKYSE